MRDPINRPADFCEKAGDRLEAELWDLALSGTVEEMKVLSLRVDTPAAFQWDAQNWVDKTWDSLGDRVDYPAFWERYGEARKVGAVLEALQLAVSSFPDPGPTPEAQASMETFFNTYYPNLLEPRP